MYVYIYIYKHVLYLIKRVRYLKVRYLKVRNLSRKHLAQGTRASNLYSKSRLAQVHCASYSRKLLAQFPRASFWFELFV